MSLDPPIVDDFTEASVKSSTIGGSRLKHHDVERLIQPKAISSIEKFELVILQGGSSEPLHEVNRKEFSYFAKKHINAIRENDSEASESFSLMAFMCFLAKYENSFLLTSCSGSELPP